MKKLRLVLTLCLLAALLCPAASAETVLKYAHMNTEDNSGSPTG